MYASISVWIYLFCLCNSWSARAENAKSCFIPNWREQVAILCMYFMMPARIAGLVVIYIICFHIKIFLLNFILFLKIDYCTRLFVFVWALFLPARKKSVLLVYSHMHHLPFYILHTAFIYDGFTLAFWKQKPHQLLLLEIFLSNVSSCPLYVNFSTSTFPARKGKTSIMSNLSLEKLTV